MGQSEHPYELAAKLLSFSGAVGAVPRSATRQVCMEAKKIMAASLAAAGAPSQRLRNVGKRGARLGVWWDVKDFGANTIGVIRATGPWQIIEWDTAPHQIPRQRRRGRTRYVRFPDGGVRRSVQHPGTRGKRPWAKGALVVARTAPRLYQAGVAAAMSSAFGGLRGTPRR